MLSMLKKCNFCHREGLAILPMRAALMPKNSQFTPLPASIEMPVAAEGETDYTATLLNEGYLYIFNEKKEEWITYYCTPNGYFTLLPPNQTEYKPSPFSKNEPCSDKPLEQANSRLITLPMFNYTGKYGVFWFAWSPVSWTKEVLKRNSDPAVYQAFMQKFDMDAWIGSGKAFNTLPIAQSQPFLNDELIRPPKKVPVHITSWHFFKKQQTSDMVAAAELLSPKRAALIVLQDPIAMAQDIGLLTQERLDEFHNIDEETQRKYWVYNVVKSMRESVIDNAERSFVSLAESVGDANLGGDIAYQEAMGASPERIQAMKDKLEVLQESAVGVFHGTSSLSPEMVMQNALNTWNIYEKYYDTTRAEAFKTEFDAKLKARMGKDIFPLKSLHTDWLGHNYTQNIFMYCFDENSEVITSQCIAYTEIVSTLVMGMQDKIPDGSKLDDDFIAKELDKDPKDKRNYFSRSAFVNNNKLIDSFSAKVPGKTGLSVVPWQGVFDIFKAVADDLMLEREGADKFKMKALALYSINKFFAINAGRMVSYMNQTLQSTSQLAPRLLIWMAGIQGRALIIKEDVISSRQMMRHVTEQLLINNPVMEKSLTQSELHSQVNKKVQQLMMVGAVDDIPKPVRYMVEIDLSEKAALDASYGKHSEGKAVSSRVYVDKITDGKILKFKPLSPWRTQLADFADNLKSNMLPSAEKYGQLGDRLPPNSNSAAGVGSVIVQIVMLGIFLSNSSQKNPEYYARTTGNTMILFGTAAGALESFVRTNPTSAEIKKLNFARRLIVNGDSILYTTFKVVGAIGAVIIAITDTYQAIISLRDGYRSQAIAYFVSATGGFLVGSSAFVGAVASTILAVVGSVLMIAAGVYFLFYSQNDLQKWLERCYFGIIHNHVQMYPTFKIEAEALQIVTNQLSSKPTKNQ